MQSVVAGQAPNNSGVEEIPQVKTEEKTKNKHTHSTTANTREAKRRLLYITLTRYEQQQKRQQPSQRRRCCGVGVCGVVVWVCDTRTSMRLDRPTFPMHESD